jgi:hypothetical protein
MTIVTPYKLLLTARAANVTPLFVIGLPSSPTLTQQNALIIWYTSLSKYGVTLKKTTTFIFGVVYDLFYCQGMLESRPRDSYSSA